MSRLPSHQLWHPYVTYSTTAANQRQKEQPIMEMTKEVEEKKLIDFVLRDDEEVLTFAA